MAGNPPVAVNFTVIPSNFVAEVLVAIGVFGVPAVAVTLFLKYSGISDALMLLVSLMAFLLLLA